MKQLRKKARMDPKQLAIQVGTALPQHGACRHFKNSFRWLRFSCCGRALPCPICHEETGCPAAGQPGVAARQLCGKCSTEQPSSNVACSACKFAFCKGGGSAHWEGGAGSRNAATMSSKDSKKFKSKAKTESKKTERVGVKAKQAREQKRIFGD